MRAIAVVLMLTSLHPDHSHKSIVGRATDCVVCIHEYPRFVRVVCDGEMVYTTALVSSQVVLECDIGTACLVKDALRWVRTAIKIHITCVWQNGIVRDMRVG